jgi:phosphonate transport system substrate-binding protein
MQRRGIFFIIFVFIFFLPGSLQDSHALQQENVQGKKQDSKQPIRIGVASMISPVDAVKYYQDIIDYLAENLEMPVKMVNRKTYDEMDRLIEKGEVEAAFIGSSSYVKNRREFGAELLVTPQVNGKVVYKSYIIVPKDSSVEKLEDLKGKTFAFTDPKSNSGKLYPVFRIAKMGYSPEIYFKSYEYTYGQNKSIELVAKGAVDGASVDGLIYEYKKERNSPYVEQTRIIEKSPDFGIPPVVSSPGISSDMKKKLKEIFMNTHRDPEGKKILAAMNMDKFVEVPDRDYDSIREMEIFVSTYAVPKIFGSKDSKIINFGVVPRDNPRISYLKYQPLIDYLTEITPYSFELVLKKSYGDTVTAIENGDLDIAILGPLTYLEAYANSGVVCILKSITEKGEPFYRSVIVAKDNHPSNELSSLKGAKFAFASMKSTSGNLLPRYILANNGVHLKELSSYKHFNYHDSVVKWVLKGKFDAGAVRETVAEKYLPLGLKIMSISGPIPTGPVVISPNTPTIIVETLKKALLKLNSTEKGKETLKKVDPELQGGFIEARDSDYEGIRKIINDVPKKCGYGCHPKNKL